MNQTEQTRRTEHPLEARLLRCDPNPRFDLGELAKVEVSLNRSTVSEGRTRAQPSLEYRNQYLTLGYYARSALRVMR